MIMSPLLLRQALQVSAGVVSLAALIHSLKYTCLTRTASQYFIFIKGGVTTMYLLSSKYYGGVSLVVMQFQMFQFQEILISLSFLPELACIFFFFLFYWIFQCINHRLVHLVLYYSSRLPSRYFIPRAYRNQSTAHFNAITSNQNK